MKIKVKTIPINEWEDCLDTIIETKEGEESASFGAGEPEDFSLGRDLNDAYKIKDMLIMAYNAGKNGEELKIEYFNERQ